MIIIKRSQQILSHLLQTAATYRARQRSRQALLALSDERLQDIGVTRAQAKAEGTKFFWQNSTVGAQAQTAKCNKTAGYIHRHSTNKV